MTRATRLHAKANQRPANVIAIPHQSNVCSDVISQLESVNFDMFGALDELDIFAQTIFEKTGDFNQLSDDNERALTAICCFLHYARQKITELKQANAVSSELIQQAMPKPAIHPPLSQGGAHE